MILTLRLYLLRLLSLMFLMFLTAWSVSAQLAGGMNETTSTGWGGNSYITGRVFYPDGSPVNTKIPIRLQSIKGEILAVTDDTGKFVFARVPNGNYTFYIEANSDFESYSQDVEVVEARSSVSLNVRLRYKAKTTPKPGVINANELQVPKKAVEFYRKAVKLADSNDRPGAIEQLKMAIAEYPSYLDAFNEMGIQYMKLNELEKAEESLQSALKIKPDAFEPLVNYGIVLFRLKKFDEAETSLRSALKIKRQSPIIHFYLGRLLTSLGRFEEAEKELNLALRESEDQMIEVHRMLANLYIAKGDSKRTIKALEKYLELNPKALDAENLRKVILELKNLKSPANSPTPKPR